MSRRLRADPAAINGADVVTWSEVAEKAAFWIVGQPLRDQLPDHGDEDRIGANRRYTNKCHVQRLSSLLCLDVEIEEDLEMIRDEADRDGDYVARPARVQCVELVQDVRL